MINDSPFSTIINKKIKEDGIDSTRKIQPKENPSQKEHLCDLASQSFNLSIKTSHITNNQEDINQQSEPKTDCPYAHQITFNSNDLKTDHNSPKSTINDETDALKPSLHSHNIHVGIDMPCKSLIINEDIKDLLNKTIEEQYSCDRNSIINFQDVWEYFLSIISIDKENTNIKDILIVEDFHEKNCFQRLFIQCSSNYQILPSLKDERHKIFSITKIPYDKNNIHHQNIFESIFKFLLQQSHPKEFNWELIGFQGEPQNDLRSIGMFGPIQILALIDHYPIFTLELFTYLVSIQSEWIFAILLLNITKLTLDLLKSGVLIVYCNQSKSIIEVINNFYFGVIYHLSKELLSQNDNLINVTNKLTADILATLMLQVKDFAKKNPGHFLWNANQLGKQYPILIMSNPQSNTNTKESNVLLP